MVIVQFWRLWYSPKSKFFLKFSRFLSQIYTLENICSNFPRLFSTLGKFSHLHIWGPLKSQFYGAVTGMKIPVLTLQRPGGGGLHRPPLFLKTRISVTPNSFFMKFYDFSSNFIYFQMQKFFFSNFEQGCRGNQFVDT